MLQLVIRTALLLTVFLALPVALIRARPYDDHDLRAFLIPPSDCPAPCFMGIRPGVTTARDAITLLEAHQWVETLQVNNDPVSLGAFDYNTSLLTELRWTWEPTAPQWINNQASGWLNFRRGYVNMIVVDTRLRLGETFLILGQPDKFAVRVFNLHTERTFRLSAWYLDTGTVISTGGLCPMHKYDLLIPLIFVSGFQQVEAFDTQRTDC